MAVSGVHTAVALVALPNPASERLHLACGLEKTGQLREVGWKFGQWIDVAWYQRMQVTLPSARPSGQQQPVQATAYQDQSEHAHHHQVDHEHHPRTGQPPPGHLTYAHDPPITRPRLNEAQKQ